SERAPGAGLFQPDRVFVGDLFRGGADVLQARAHPVPVRPEREDADAEGELRAEHRAGEVDTLAAVDRLEEGAVQGIRRVAVEARPREAERDDRKLRLRENLD